MFNFLLQLKLLKCLLNTCSFDINNPSSKNPVVSDQENVAESPGLLHGYHKIVANKPKLHLQCVLWPHLIGNTQTVVLSLSSNVFMKEDGPIYSSLRETANHTPTFWGCRGVSSKAYGF
jgi:hypothetical protein